MSKITLDILTESAENNRILLYYGHPVVDGKTKPNSVSLWGTALGVFYVQRGSVEIYCGNSAMEAIETYNREIVR